MSSRSEYGLHSGAAASAGEASIDVWTFPLQCDDRTLGAGSAFLAPDERRRAGKFRFERHRRRYIVRRAMRRIVLAQYVGLDPASLDFHEPDGGRPSLTNGPPGLVFNASHSEDFGVVVTGPVMLGVDIECLDRKMDVLDFAQRKFTPEEANEIQTQRGDARLRAFFCCWTGKEAYIKALGVGLRKDLASFAVHATPGRPPGLRWDRQAVGSETHWTFHRFCHGRYLMTIAVPDAEPGLEVLSHGLSVRSLRDGKAVPAEQEPAWQPC